MGSPKGRQLALIWGDQGLSTFSGSHPIGLSPREPSRLPGSWGHHIWCNPSPASTPTCGSFALRAAIEVRVVLRIASRIVTSDSSDEDVHKLCTVYTGAHSDCNWALPV